MSGKIKVLQLLGGGNAIGGVEQMLLNYYSFMDRNKVQFDFCFYRKSTYDVVYEQYKDVLESSKIYSLNAFKGKSSFGGYVRTIPMVRKLIKENQYNIVHINAGRFPLLICGLLAAWMGGAKVRMTHSHSTKGREERSKVADFIYTLIALVLRPIFKNLSSNLFACSTEAAKYMFGDSIVKSDKYRLVHNAVNVDLYKFNNEKRESIRKNFGIADDITLFGHVGRFSKEKNQLFLIDVFFEIKKKMQKSHLWLIGDGDEDLKGRIIEKIYALGLEKDVTLLASRKDVRDLDQALDCMIFPSTYEGLSVVLIEAQCAALPVFASDCISPEHKITDLVNFISLGKGKEYWSEYIIDNLERMPLRGDVIEEVTRSGYNIEVEAKSLQELYIKSAQQ